MHALILSSNTNINWKYRRQEIEQLAIPRNKLPFSRSLYHNKSQINHFPSAIIFASGVYGSSPPHRDESISRKISIVPKIAPSEAKWFLLSNLEIEKCNDEEQGVVYFTRIARGKFVGVKEWMVDHNMFRRVGPHLVGGATRKEPHFGRPATRTLPP